MPTELFANTATTTLGAAITTTGATTLTVASSALFPAAVTGVSQFRIKIDAEYLIVTNVAGTTWTVTRGAEGSTAATHLSAAPATHVLTAGGLAGAVTVTPDSIPVVPSAFDYEFNESGVALPSGWSWLNQGASTYAENLGVGALSITAGGSDEWRGITRGIPSASSFTATAKMTMITKQIDNTYPSKSLTLHDSVSGKMVVLMVTFPPVDVALRGVISVAVDNYTNATTWASRTVTVNVAGAWEANYFRMVKNSATSWDFLVSPDGAAWLPIVTGVNVSTFITPDRIGIAVNTRANAPVCGLHWFRVV